MIQERYDHKKGKMVGKMEKNSKNNIRKHIATLFGCFKDASSKKIVIAMFYLIALALIFTVSAQAAAAAGVERSISVSGNTATITLTATGYTGSYFIIVRDNIPGGFTYVSGGELEGTQVKGLLGSLTGSTLTYTLTGIPGTHTISGTYQGATDPSPIATTGQNQIIIAGTPGCTPSWQCTAWSPAVCPVTQIQTRTCTDASLCNNNTGKPTEQQSCTYDNPGTTPPTYATFNGATTNFNSHPNVKAVSNAVLEKTGYGKIAFGSQSLNFEALNLDSYVTINNNAIGLNPIMLTSINVPATLTLYNLNLANPKIMTGGNICSPSICQIISYNNGILTFTVQHFSYYYAAEAGSTFTTATDDYQVNYIRGKVAINGNPAPAGTEAIVTVTSGKNAGYSKTYFVDSNIPSFLRGNGYFDTMDDTAFSTGDSFIVEVPYIRAARTGIFLNGGNGDFVTGNGLIDFNITTPSLTLSNIPDTTITEDSTLPATIADLYLYTIYSGDFSNLNYHILTQSNSQLANCRIESNRYVRCTSPAANAFGQNIVDIQVEDIYGTTDTGSLSIIVSSVNDLPVLYPIGPQYATEDQLYTLQVSATDADSTALTYSSNSTIFTINSATGLVSFTPTNAQVGVYSINFSVTDGINIRSEVVRFEVIGVNDPPTVTTPIPPQFTDEDVPLTLVIDDYIFDEDNNYAQLLVQLENSCNFTLTVIRQDANNLVVNITPAANLNSDMNAGLPFTIGLRITDAGGAITTTTFLLTVNPVNDAPILSPIADQTAVESMPFTVDADATDVENDPITYSLVSAPSGAMINATSGVITWAPLYQQVGNNTFIVRARDTNGAYDEEEFVVTVYSALDILGQVDITIDGFTYYNVPEEKHMDGKPGSVVIVNFDVINRLNIPIEDIRQWLAIVCPLYCVELRNESIRYNLESMEVRHFELTLILPKIIEEDTYDLQLHGEGIDSNGIPRIFDKLYYIDIVKNLHDVEFSSIVPSEGDDTILKCYKKTMLNISLSNLGHVDEDDIILRLTSPDLASFGTKEYNIGYINDMQILNIQKELDLSSAPIGDYTFNAEIVYNNNGNRAYNTFRLSVENCELPNEYTIQEDTTPPYNWIDIWQHTSNGLPGSAFTYSIHSQNNSALINCWLTDDPVTVTKRYLNCARPTADMTGSNLINISYSRKGVVNYLNTLITVVPANDAPYQVAPLPFTTINEDIPTTLSWSLNDYFIDIDSAGLIYTVQNSAHISAVIGNDKRLTLTPTENFIGPEQLRIIVSDGEHSVNSTLTVNVLNTDNDAPVIYGFIPDPSTIPILPNDVRYNIRINASDPDGEPIFIRWYVDNVLRGTLETFTFEGNNSPGIQRFRIRAEVTDGVNMVSDSFYLRTTEGPYSDDYIINWTGPLNEAYLTIIKPGIGMIEILEPVDLTQIGQIDPFVTIELGRAGIDVRNYGYGYDLHTLAGKESRITLYRISGYDYLPTIHRNSGFTVTDNDPACGLMCTGVSYQGSTLSFLVDSFSVYWVYIPGAPVPVPPPPNNGLPDNSFLFGGPDQEASDPDNDKNIILTKTFTVVNNNDCAVTLENIIVTPKLGFTADDLKITLIDINPQMLGPGEIAYVTLSARIPEGLNAVDEELMARAFNTADIFFTGIKCGNPSNDVIGVYYVYMQRKNHLELDKAVFDFNDKSKKANEDNDKIEDLKPGSSVDMTATVKNTFDEDDNIDIDDVKLMYSSEDSDLDIDEDEDIGTVSADEEEEETLEFDIESDADDKNYGTLLSAFGFDKYEARHGEAWDLGLKVDREKNDVEIQSLTLSPSTLSCDRRSTVFLDASLLNIGKKDLEFISLEINALELGYHERIDGIVLDKDDSVKKTFGIIIPENTSSRDYPISIDAFIDSELIDSEMITLSVQDCNILPVDNGCDGPCEAAPRCTTLRRPSTYSGPCTDECTETCFEYETTCTEYGDCEEYDGVIEEEVELTTPTMRSIVFAKPIKTYRDKETESPSVIVKSGNGDEMIAQMLLIIFVILLVGLLVFIYGAAVILQKKKRRRMMRARMARQQMQKED